jgi:steroid delta-isomerase-like uncharacterized protein
MATATSTTTAETNKAIIRRLIDEFWNKGKMELANELAAPDFIRIELFSTNEQRGPEGLRSAAREWRGAFPDVHLATHEMIAEGDKVSLQWTFTGTNKGELKGTPPTGKSVKVSGISHISFANGKMREEVVATDLLGMMKQLGLLPS